MNNTKLAILLLLGILTVAVILYLITRKSNDNNNSISERFKEDDEPLVLDDSTDLSNINLIFKNDNKDIYNFEIKQIIFYDKNDKELNPEIVGNLKITGFPLINPSSLNEQQINAIHTLLQIDTQYKKIFDSNVSTDNKFKPIHNILNNTDFYQNSYMYYLRKFSVAKQFIDTNDNDKVIQTWLKWFKRKYAIRDSTINQHPISKSCGPSDWRKEINEPLYKDDNSYCFRVGKKFNYKLDYLEINKFQQLYTKLDSIYNYHKSNLDNNIVCRIQLRFNGNPPRKMLIKSNNTLIKTLKVKRVDIENQPELVLFPETDINLTKNNEQMINFNYIFKSEIPTITQAPELVEEEIVEPTTTTQPPTTIKQEPTTTTIPSTTTTENPNKLVLGDKSTIANNKQLPVDMENTELFCNGEMVNDNITDKSLDLISSGHFL